MTGDETGKLFAYDAWNRLVAVKSSGGTVLKTYGYDALNHRASETVSGTTTDLYDSAGWQVLEERVGGVTRVSNVWSPVYVDAMIARDRDTDANGSLDERLYVTHDANFNVTGLVNTGGAVVERYAYDSYGAATALGVVAGAAAPSVSPTTTIGQSLACCSTSVWPPAIGHRALPGASRRLLGNDSRVSCRGRDGHPRRRRHPPPRRSSEGFGLGDGGGGDPGRRGDGAGRRCRLGRGTGRNTERINVRRAS